jgi:outer membrane protein TolC
LLAGCGEIVRTPELEPTRYASRTVEQPWSPPAAEGSAYKPQLSVSAGLQILSEQGIQNDRVYELSDLIYLALSHNPDTRVAWEQARAQAAAWAATRANYYPKLSTETDFEYSRQLFPIGGGTARIKVAQITPTIQLTYTLLDFGRRRAESATAAEQLAAANFAFNRRIQDVVFGAERYFFSLAAARAAVDAARQNLELARTDDDAVAKRVDHGLATKPELLLSRQRVAQAEYDVANAELLVEDAQANLATALGLPANLRIRVAGLEHEAIPAGLEGQVDDLIQQAIQSRPDLAANVATVRAGKAQLEGARSEFMPEIDVSGFYGEQNWGYSFNNQPHITANTPEYSALLALKWNIFTGFSRINRVREDEARERASQAQLEANEIAVIAEVWRTYYAFKSLRKRYEYAKALLSASDESYRSLIDTYRQGLSTIVELLSAERDLANARYTMIQATADLLTASAAVSYAVGTIAIPRKQ